MSLETSLEHSKCDLALKPDFNLVDAFRIFDPMQKGWISLDEFFEGLLTLGLHSVQADLQLVFQRYDMDRDGRLRYSEFCNMLTPKSLEIAQILSGRSSYYIHKSYYRREEFFHPDT